MSVWTITPFGAMGELQEFIINGRGASYEDFGDKEDISPEMAEGYGCGNMRFTTEGPEKSVLAKYEITADEYTRICSELEEALSFGECGWCE